MKSRTFRKRAVIVCLAVLVLFAALFHWSTKFRNIVLHIGRRLSLENFDGRIVVQTSSGWEKYANNPVVGGSLGTCFDCCVLREKPGYRMYFSWRPEKCIATCASEDGIHWSAPEKSLLPAPGEWDAVVNRPSVVKHNGTYFMWYTGQYGGRSAAIGIANSKDGIHFERQERSPVFQSRDPWEKKAVLSPDVMWDKDKQVYDMWYSAGEEFEPDAIGFATSSDGIKWSRDRSEPILKPNPSQRWEHAKVTGSHVTRVGDYFYMFYIGFADVFTASIGIARSKNGIDGWERNPSNPIVRRGGHPRDWDFDAVYKPFVERTDQGGWILWFNGRNLDQEQIGVALHPGAELWDVKSKQP